MTGNMAEPVHDATASTGALRRSIGAGMLTLFVIGNILGAGIYAVIGEVADEAGGLSWASFVVAAALAAFTAASYVELTTTHRSAGGAALYVQEAFGRSWLIVMTIVAVASAAITSAATSAQALASSYLGTFVELPSAPVAIGFVLVLSLLNWWGISASMRANVALTVIIVAGLLLVAAVGLWALLDGSGSAGRLLEAPEDSSAWPLAVLGGASLAFFAFVGFEDAAQVAEETRRPGRAYPIALGVGLVLTLLIYLAVSAAAVLVVDPADLGDSEAPLVEVLEQGSSIPGWTVAAVAIVALTNTALLQLVASSRLLYGMSRAERLPPALRRVDASRNTPWLAVVTVGVLAAALAATGGLATLADTTVLLLLTVFVLVNLSLLSLRRRHPGEDEGEVVRVPLVVPWIGATASAGLIGWSAWTSGWPVVTRYLGLLGLGLLLWFVQERLAHHTDLIDVDDIDGLEPWKRIDR